MSYRIHIKKAADFAEPQHTQVTLSDRLPRHIVSAGVIECRYAVEKRGAYYLLTLHTSGVLEVCCQRCLNTFEYLHDNTSLLACCRSEEQAEQLMSQYESMVVLDNVVDLEEVVIDELHLSVPEKHPDADQCGNINDFD